MAVLVRLFNFVPNTLIQSGQVNSEFNQLVDILAGNSTTKNALIRFSDAAVAVLAVDQIGAGLIQQWKQNGVEKARVNNDGSLFIPSVKDTNNNAFLIFSSTASAVNQLTLANAATGGLPTFSATGSDTDISLSIVPKAAGTLRLGPNVRIHNNNAGALVHNFNPGTSTYSPGTQDQLVINTDGTINPRILTFANAGTAKWHWNFTSNSDLNFVETTVADFRMALKIGGGVTINRDPASLGAMLDVLSKNTSTVGLIIDLPTSPTVDIAKFRVNGADKLQIKNNGQIISVPKSIKTDSSVVGNSTTTLTDLHTFTLPAGSLNANGDYIRVRYSGPFAANANTKRIVILFGGQTVHDPGLFDQRTGGWTYDIVYLRVSATSIMTTILAAWNAITRDGAGVMGNNGFLFAGNGAITVTDLGANSQVMKVQAQGTATNDIQQNFSVIELVQNT